MAKTEKKATEPAEAKKPRGKKAEPKQPGLKKIGLKKIGPKKLRAEKAAPKKASPKKIAQKLTKPGKRAAAPPPPAPPPVPLAPPMTVGASASVLERLWTVVDGRRDADPALSHSARLLKRGTAKVAQKFGEEAVECVIEAVGGNRAALVGESADVLYHLIVMWVDAGVRPGEVWAELQRREGVSGVAEKASRARALPGELGVGTTKIP